MIETVYRVRCDGPCQRWLRAGRPAPAHWGPMYASAFPTPEAASQAALDAGWTGGLCPDDQTKENRT